MPIYDLSTQLKHRLGNEFTTASIGLAGFTGLWNDEKSYDKPIQIGTVFELLLLYTMDRKVQMRPEGQRVFTEEEKRVRGGLAYKVRDCKRIELEEHEVNSLRSAISVLPVEPNYLINIFLDNPEV